MKEMKATAQIWKRKIYCSKGEWDGASAIFTSPSTSLAQIILHASFTIASRLR
jgi:hypothetical protein